jgi:large subunit ribosomal protein L35Ae
MEAIITSFRRGRKTQTPNQMIILPPQASKESSTKLVGKKVVYKTEAGKNMTGTITAVHGAKGAVRAHFETGMPGQAIGAKVTIQ